MLRIRGCFVQVGDKIDYVKVVDGLQNLQVNPSIIHPPWSMMTHWCNLLGHKRRGYID
jgi:hypothetical protein